MTLCKSSLIGTDWAFRATSPRLLKTRSVAEDQDVDLDLSNLIGVSSSVGSEAQTGCWIWLWGSTSVLEWLSRHTSNSAFSSRLFFLRMDVCWETRGFVELKAASSGATKGRAFTAAGLRLRPDSRPESRWLCDVDDWAGLEDWGTFCLSNGTGRRDGVAWVFDWPYQLAWE